MPVWDSEIEVDSELACALISEQFPSLEATPLRRVGQGWDNTVWATEQDIAFRFPRRQIAIPGVQREIAVLPGLSQRLPVPIPDARYVGRATRAFPWPWFGSRMIAGTEIAACQLAVEHRGRLASDLGAFLATLHRCPPPTDADLPIDPMGRADMTTRAQRARSAIDDAAALWCPDGRVDRILDTAMATEPDAEPVLVHGDLNLRHALVSSSGALAGVIDWGDVCLAPRSVDLALYWSLFDASARDRFRRAYGTLTSSTLARARVLALFMDATLALYAHDTGMTQLRRHALDGLERTLAD